MIHSRKRGPRAQASNDARAVFSNTHGRTRDRRDGRRSLFDEVDRSETVWIEAIANPRHTDVCPLLCVCGAAYAWERVYVGALRILKQHTSSR